MYDNVSKNKVCLSMEQNKKKLTLHKKSHSKKKGWDRVKITMSTNQNKK